MLSCKAKDGKNFNLVDISAVQLVSTSMDFPNIYWIVFWFLFFFPVALVMMMMGLSRKKYTCIITVWGQKSMHDFDQAAYTLLKIGGH